MAKKRYINDNIREDNYVMDLDPSEKLLFIYLLTNNKVSLCGIYEIHIRKIQMELGFDKDLVHRIFLRFEKEDKVYYRNGYIFIANFVKNQSMNDNMKKGLERELNELGKENLLLFYDLKGFERLGKDLKSLGILNLTLLNLTLPNLSEEIPPQEEIIKPKKSFPPSLETIKTYCEENNILTDYEGFFYHYESNGRMVSKNKMKSWTAALAQWKRREKARGNEVKDDILDKYEKCMLMCFDKQWTDEGLNLKLQSIAALIIEKYGLDRTKEIKKELRTKHKMN